MLDLLRRRRSIRKFKADRLPPDAVATLSEALLRSPSSRGINPWVFVLVDDPNTLEKLSRAKQHGSEFLKGAPFAVVVCADTTASDVWIEDCSIAAIILQLESVSLGLGSCWAQIRCRQHTRERTAESYIRELLGLPDHIAVECVIGIGYPAENKRPVAASTLEQGKIRINRWE